MLNWLRKTANTLTGFLVSDAIEDESEGSQKSFDAQAPRWYYGQYHVIHPFPLNYAFRLYQRDALAYYIAEQITMYVTAPVRVVAENEELQQYIERRNRELQIDRIVEELARDDVIAGFAGQEIVGDGSTLASSNEILGLSRIDPRTLYVEKTPRGRVRFYRQRPTGSYGGGLLTLEAELDPATVCYCSTFYPGVYGVSTYQPTRRRYHERQKLLNAALKSAENFACYFRHWHYQVDPTRPEDREDVKDQRKLMMRQVRAARKKNIPDIFSAGTGDYKPSIIGPATVPDISKQIELVTRDIICASGLSPATFGFDTSSSQASAKQVVNNIVARQQRIMRALQKLYELIPVIEPACPSGEFACSLEEPTLESLKEKAERFATEITNALLLGKSGGYTAQQAASALGLLNWADEDKWDQYTSNPELSSFGVRSTAPGVNPNDPNQQQQRVAAANQSRLRGNRVSNNPAGTKGNNEEQQ
jgi:hypothetical protein